MARPLLLCWFVMHLRQMFTAGLGGIAATVADVTVLVLLVTAGTPVAIAAFVAASTGAVIGFVMNKYIAFGDHSPISLHQCARFGGVALATAVLMAAAMHVAAHTLAAPVLPAKLACSALVFALWTYPAQRRLVFVSPVSRASGLSPSMSLS